MYSWAIGKRRCLNSLLCGSFPLIKKALGRLFQLSSTAQSPIPRPSSSHHRGSLFHHLCRMELLWEHCLVDQSLHLAIPHVKVANWTAGELYFAKKEKTKERWIIKTIKTQKSIVLAQHRSLLARTREKRNQATFILYRYQSSMASISSTPLLTAQFHSCWK